MTKKLNKKQYDAIPEMILDTAKEYSAVVKMENGKSFTIRLSPDKAPITVNSFVFLAKEGFF